MGRLKSGLGFNIFWICVLALLLSNAGFVERIEALTASYGQPYHGRLVNGIPFPSQFPGYSLREEDRTYTTPEIVGALLDAIESVRTQFPDTCDLYIGDFSQKGGGGAIHHRSHQNGRDVDIGLYAKGNRKLDTLMVMTEDNLDVPKTWCLIENIIRSQRVQYIFLDRRIQRLLYDYAVSQGADSAYLDHVFGNVRGSLIQHVANHNDHMHVRFFTPWSTLAAHVGEEESQKHMVIEMAQQAYLPKQVNYYVKGNERSLDALAQSFGVTPRDLCRWNRISSSNVPTPGSCLVFYKRGFEVDAVHLAQSLQPGFVVDTPPIQYASLRGSTTGVVSDVSVPEDETPAPSSRSTMTRSRRHDAPSAPSYTLYKVQKGDTVEKVARKNHMDVKTLCRMNGMKKPSALKPGHTIKLASAKTSSGQASDSGYSSSRSSGSRSSRNISLSTDKKSCSTAATYTVGKGDTLQRISRQTGIGIDALCQMNGLKKGTTLMPGRQIKLAQSTARTCPAGGPSAVTSKSQSSHKNQSAVKAQRHDKSASSVKGSSKTVSSAKSASSAKGSSKAAGTKEAKAKTRDAQSAKGSSKAVSSTKDSKAKTKEARSNAKDSKGQAKKQPVSKDSTVSKGKTGKTSDKLAKR